MSTVEYPSFTHVGKSRAGKRLHLTGENGFSCCGIKCEHLLSLDEFTPPSDAQWCQSCMASMSSSAIRSAQEVRPRTPRIHGAEGQEIPSVWNAKAEAMVGRMIQGYLAAYPAPDGAHFASSFEGWSERLIAAGDHKLPWEPTPEEEAWSYVLCGLRLALTVEGVERETAELFPRMARDAEQLVWRGAGKATGHDDGEEG